MTGLHNMADSQNHEKYPNMSVYYKILKVNKN